MARLIQDFLQRGVQATSTGGSTSHKMTTKKTQNMGGIGGYVVSGGGAHPLLLYEQREGGRENLGKGDGKLRFIALCWQW